jgi:WD40 repeat protein
LGGSADDPGFGESSIVTASADGAARIWNAANGRTMSVFRESAPVLSAVFSPDGARIATGAPNGSVRVWDVASGRALARLVAHGDVISVAFSADGALLATGALYDDAVRVWDVVQQRQIAAFSGHEIEWVYSVAFRPGGHSVISASPGRTARLWDVEDNREAVVLRGHRDELRSAAFSSDGMWIVTASRDGVVRI